VRPHTIIRTLAAAALIALPSMAMAAPDQNSNGRYGNNNGCGQYVNGQWVAGRWVNGQCVNNTNGNWNNNGNNSDWQRRERERQRERERWEREHANGAYNNGGYNNGGYGNYGGYGGYNNGNQLTGTVSSFSPYNLYLNNGLHVVLHNGTVINPTGTNLTPGQRVRVIGYRQGDGTFAANEIDVVGNGYNGYNRYLR
jgi:Domain of unknown function (DUF5666)